MVAWILVTWAKLSSHSWMIDWLIDFIDRFVIITLLSASRCFPTATKSDINLSIDFANASMSCCCLSTCEVSKIFSVKPIILKIVFCLTKEFKKSNLVQAVRAVAAARWLRAADWSIGQALGIHWSDSRFASRTRPTAVDWLNRQSTSARSVAFETVVSACSDWNWVIDVSLWKQCEYLRFTKKKFEMMFQNLLM